MSFLPTNYEVPAVGGNYLKLKKGTTKIRVLSSAIVGREDWDGKTPIRTKTKQPAITKDKSPKHFWAFSVWDYEDKKVKIYPVNQRSLQDGIAALVNDEDYGDPKGYDLKITREGEGMETKYSLIPGLKSDIPGDALAELNKIDINLEALFDGIDPFTPASKDDDDSLPF